MSLGIWNGRVPPAAPRAPDTVTLGAEDAPQEAQGTPDSLRGGRWRGRPTYPAQRLAIGATPARIAAVLRQAEQGYPAPLAALIQDVTDRDPQMVSVLGTRKRAVAHTDFEVLPGGDRPRDRHLAAEVDQMLRQVKRWHGGLTDLLAGIENGFAAVEIEWAIVNGKACPARLAFAAPWWFKPDPDDPYALRILDTENLVEGMPLVENRWIVHHAEAKPGFPVQAGLGRVFLWYWLFKHYGLKDWVAYSELFGAPIRIGKFPSHASSEDQIDALEDALQQIGVNAYAVIPQEMAIEFVGDTNRGIGGTTVYSNLLEFCDKAIAKLVLGQTLTTEQGSSGSYALGQVHNAVRGDIRLADASQLADTLTDQLIGPYVQFNHGPDVPLPRLQFLTDPPKDKGREADAQSKRADVLKKAAQMNIPVSLAQARDELGIDPVQDGEELLVLSGGQAGNDKPDDDDDNDPDDDGEE